MKRLNRYFILILLQYCAVNALCDNQHLLYQKRIGTRLTSYIHYLGKDMDSIAVIPPFQITKREEEGDEGEYWNMLECRHKGKIMLVLEGNWIAKNKISRITILSPTIRLNNIFVGQTIKNIRDQIDDKRIESAPDGILLLPIKGYKNIVLQMDISHISPNNPLWFGVYKVKTLPPNMRIQSIIITEDFINE